MRRPFELYGLLNAVGLRAKYYHRRMKPLMPRLGIDESPIVFIHIPKCAGTSIWSSIPTSTPIDSHILARTWLDFLGEDKWRKSLKFSVVRNPWDRFVSAYFYLYQREPGNPDYLFSQEYIKPYSIEEFLERFATNWTFRNIILGWLHFIPQVEFLKIRSTVSQEIRLARFENLAEEVDAILASHGITANAIPRANVSIRSRYRDYYTPKTQEAVLKAYRQDIEALEYSF